MAKNGLVTTSIFGTGLDVLQQQRLDWHQPRWMICWLEWHVMPMMTGKPRLDRRLTCEMPMLRRLTWYVSNLNTFNYFCLSDLHLEVWHMFWKLFWHFLWHLKHILTCIILTFPMTYIPTFNSDILPRISLTYLGIFSDFFDICFRTYLHPASSANSRGHYRAKPKGSATRNTPLAWRRQRGVQILATLAAFLLILWSKYRLIPYHQVIRSRDSKWSNLNHLTNPQK